jgi:hypothetical protein
MLYYVSIKEILKNADSGMYYDESRQFEIEKSWYRWDCSDSELRDKMVKFVSYLRDLVQSNRINRDTMCVSFNSNDPTYSHDKFTDAMRIKDSQTGQMLFLFTFQYDNGEYVEVIGPGHCYTEVLVSGSWKDVVKFFQSPVKKSKRR